MSSDLKMEHKLVLEVCNKDEITYIMEDVDINKLLDIIKTKRYSSQHKRLGGRLDKKNPLLRKMLPIISGELYIKKERPFEHIIEMQVNEYKHIFNEVVNKEKIEFNKIKKYTTELMTNFYIKFIEECKRDISVELFCVILKLEGITFDDEYYNCLKNQIEMELKCRMIIKEQVDEYKEKIRGERFSELVLAEKDKLEKQWHLEYEKELEEKHSKVEDDLNTKLDEMKKQYDKEINGLKEDLDNDIKGAKEKYIEKLEEIEKDFYTEYENYNLKLEELVNKKKELEEQIDGLEQKKIILDSEIKKLEKIEDNYFETFEQRIIERKIESIILKKLGFDKHNDNEVEEQVKPVCNFNNEFRTKIIPAKAFSCDTEYGEIVNSIEDIFIDYTSNIEINFHEGDEIAALVLATLSNEMSIIASNEVCNYLAESLSALLDYSLPCTINVDIQNENISDLAEAINMIDSQVILIKGVLDNYNELLYTRICEMCKEKYLFFAISDLDKLKMMTKTIYNYSVVIDVEREVCFPKDESMLIGDTELKLFVPSLEVNKSQEIYKKNFNRLVKYNYIKNITAIKYSNLVQLYCEIIDVCELGKVLQRGILFACDLAFEDENIEQILNKSGITIVDEWVRDYED